MARYANPAMLNAALTWLADADYVCVCEGQPTDFTDAYVTKSLCNIGVTSGCFTQAAGGVSGRKTTIAVCGGEVTTSGSADHLAVVNTSASTLNYVWVLTEQYVVSGNPLTTPELYAEIRDPAAP